VIRINRDGSIPKDNPWLGRATVFPETFAHGLRDPEGAAPAAMVVSPTTTVPDDSGAFGIAQSVRESFRKHGWRGPATDYPSESTRLD